MLNDSPTILALDFDGVICNGLREYFEIAWRAYSQIWQQEVIDQTDQTDRTSGTKESWRQAFYSLRPVVETGWEMPLILRALQLGFTEENILERWGSIADQLVTTENLQAGAIAKIVDGLRDRWIAGDVNNWLSYHEFYPGTVEKVQQTQAQGIEVLIISTKEGRFIQELLTQAGINLPRQAILGKETNRPKPEILQELLVKQPQPGAIWFVEDRLKTLEKVARIPALEGVNLFLADWGYNTQAMRATVRDTGDDRPWIKLISLPQFSQDFHYWL